MTPQPTAGRDEAASRPEASGAPDQHAADEFCFFCAPDYVLSKAASAALRGAIYHGPTIWMQKPMRFCPNADAAELAEHEAALAAAKKREADR
ncbi:MAG TPA: hypothetical protein VGL02_32190 [Streptomyces sp.]